MPSPSPLSRLLASLFLACQITMAVGCHDGEIAPATDRDPAPTVDDGGIPPADGAPAPEGGAGTDPVPLGACDNVALGATATAPGPHYEDLDASRAVDALIDQGSGWVGTGLQALTVDLGEVVTLDRLEVNPFSHASATQYYYSDTWRVRHSRDGASWRDFEEVVKETGAGTLVTPGLAVSGGDPGTVDSDEHKFYELTFVPVDARYLRYEVTVGDEYGSSLLDEIAACRRPPPAGRLDLADPSLEVEEAAGAVTIHVVRAGAAEGAIEVRYATHAGSATAGEDFVAADGILRFADGEVSQRIDLALLDDDLGEGDESLTVSLSDPTGGSVIGPVNVTTVIIRDDDVSPLPPLPRLARWEANMVEHGETWCSRLAGSGDLNTTYYDGEWVFYQIGDYTGVSRWYDCAQRAENVYRDGYLVPNGFRVPGYWRFPHGLLQDHLRGGDTTIAQIRDIRDEPAYSNPDVSSYSDNWFHAAYSREVAYALQAQVAAEKAGEPRNATRVRMFVEMATNHLDQWQANDYSIGVDHVVRDGEYDFMQPFMTGLTLHALIELYEWEVASGRDPDALYLDLPGRIRSFVTWLWDAPMIGVPGTVRVSDYPDHSGSHTTFRYRNKCALTCGGATTADDVSLGTPDLNLLIAPAYAWVAQQFGDPSYVTGMGDPLWITGVELAAVHWGGKQFNQSYRWSFDYVRWRSAVGR